MTNHKSRIWRDIDKHPLPNSSCAVDVKLDCGSILIDCELIYYRNKGYTLCSFRGSDINFMGRITQWRDAK